MCQLSVSARRRAVAATAGRDDRTTLTCSLHGGYAEGKAGCRVANDSPRQGSPPTGQGRPWDPGRGRGIVILAQKRTTNRPVRPSVLVRFGAHAYGHFMSHRTVCVVRSGALALVMGLASLGSSDNGNAQQSVRLELAGTPGDWLQYDHRNDLVVDLPTDLGGPATTRTTIRMRQTVEGVSDEALSYLTTLEEVSLEVRPTPDELPDLSGIQGLRFHHTASRAGRTLSLRLAGETSEAGPGLLEQMENWLSQLGFPPLPGGAVEVGAEWSETLPVPAMALGLAVDFDVVQTRTVRLTEVRSAGSASVAFLVVTTTWKPSPDPGGSGGGVASLRGSAEQVVRFDTARGRFLGSTGTSELELVLTPEGRAQYVAVSATGRQITGLTASSEPGADLRE